MIRILRLWLAEKLMGITLSILPAGQEKGLFADFIVAYTDKVFGYGWWRTRVPYQPGYRVRLAYKNKVIGDVSSLEEAREMAARAEIEGPVDILRQDERGIDLWHWVEQGPAETARKAEVAK